jgi:hypothetical protein
MLARDMDTNIFLAFRQNPFGFRPASASPCISYALRDVRHIHSAEMPLNLLFRFRSPSFLTLSVLPRGARGSLDVSKAYRAWLYSTNLKHVISAPTKLSRGKCARPCSSQCRVLCVGSGISTPQQLVQWQFFSSVQFRRGDGLTPCLLPKRSIRLRNISGLDGITKGKTLQEIR